MTGYFVMIINKDVFRFLQKQRLMRTNFLYIFFIILVNGNTFSQSCPTGNEREISVNPDFERQVIKLTNKEREKRGLKPLEMDESLSYSARYHAKDMAVEDYFDHDSFDRKENGQLKRVCGTFERIEAFANFGTMAENISAGRTTPEAVVEGWMKSPGHRKNILNKNFKKLGVGFYQTNDSEYHYYWVQNFGG